MKKKLILFGIILSIVTLTGGVVLYRSQSQATPIAPLEKTNSSTSITKITFSNNGFTPAAVLVKRGDIIEVLNASSEDLKLNSDPHPIHTYNSELNLGKVVKGESKRFVVSKKGNFYYHNHLNSSQTGRIVVR